MPEVRGQESDGVKGIGVAGAELLENKVEDFT